MIVSNMRANQMRLGIIGLVLGIGLTGCVSTPPAEPLVYGRVDCQRGADRPDLQLDFEQAQAICLPRGQAAAVAGTTAIPVGYGIGGAIASGIQRGQAQNEIAYSTAVSCMAERGYLFKTRAEHDRTCAAIAAQRSPARPMAPTRRP